MQCRSKDTIKMRKEIMNLVTDLLNRLGIKVKEKELSYEEARAEFVDKYACSLKIGDDAEQQYNEYRMGKYGGGKMNTDKAERVDEFNKIAGSLKLDKIPSVEERNEIRASRYMDKQNIIDYAGIGKDAVDIPDDINIKEMKFSDPNYHKKYGLE